MPLLVIADDQESVQEHFDPHDSYELVEADHPGDVLLSLMGPNDLIVAPSYLLAQMPVHRRVRLAKPLAAQNLAIVAAPGRFAVMGTRPGAMERFLGQHS